MRLVVIVMAALTVGAGTAHAGDKVVPLDKLLMVHDGKGHYLAYRPAGHQTLAGGETATYRLVVYMGTGKTFYRISVSSPAERPLGGEGDFQTKFRDPRFQPADGKDSAGWRRQDLKREGERIVVKCGPAEKTFIPVGEKRRQKILRSAKQVEVFPRRVPSLLARDNVGTYYYIDRHRDPKRTYDRRLYIGRRGRMRSARLRDVVIDVAGDLYVTSKGTLKVDWKMMDKNPQAIAWLPKHKPPGTALTHVSRKFSTTINFIYGDLGIYLGKPYGTPCDWF